MPPDNQGAAAAATPDCQHGIAEKGSRVSETQMTPDEFEIMQLKAEILRLKAERDFLIAWLEGIFADARG